MAADWFTQSVVAADWFTQSVVAADWFTQSVVAADWFTQSVVAADWLIAVTCLTSSPDLQFVICYLVCFNRSP